jgi:hypothetical protein
MEANEHNFSRAMTLTILWQMGALVVIFFLSFLLPAKPRSREEMERLAEAGVVGMV